MYYGVLNFEQIPRIGFAHHCYTEQHTTVYGKHHRGFEVAYITSGKLTLHVEGKTFTAAAGSVIVLFRELPITLSTTAPQSHCTVQAEMPFTVRLTETAEGSDGLLLPIIVPPCAETEVIKKLLFGIISDRSTERKGNDLSLALNFLNVLRTLDTVAKREAAVHTPASLVSYQTKRYIAEHLRHSITLQDLSQYFGKTPNYINRLFREANGITINQYINRERVQLIASLIRHGELSFKSACENAGIADIAYGYRLFKKHTGITPKQYLYSNTYD